MAKALEPAVTTDDIVFELERFERSEGRLRLTGRWFGVRGRRFVRPTLTLDLEGERSRALADLDDKPWAAEDGEPWTASFPWPAEGRAEASELSVAPDIAIQLPAPSSRRSRSRRLSAVPRRQAMTASWGEFSSLAEAEATNGETAGPEPFTADSDPVDPVLAIPAIAEAEPEPPDPAFLLAEIEALQERLTEAAAQLQARTAEVDAVRNELASTRTELEGARRELELRGGRSDAAQAELAAARAGRETALRNAARSEAEREAALTRAAQAERERDGLAVETARLAETHERTRAELEQLAREHEQVVVSRGAALVMRRATQGLPAYEHHVGWWRRGLALLGLIGVVFAALIILHVL